MRGTCGERDGSLHALPPLPATERPPGAERDCLSRIRGPPVGVGWDKVSALLGPARLSSARRGAAGVSSCLWYGRHSDAAPQVHATVCIGTCDRHLPLPPLPPRADEPRLTLAALNSPLSVARIPSSAYPSCLFHRPSRHRRWNIRTVPGTVPGDRPVDRSGDRLRGPRRGPPPWSSDDVSRREAWSGQPPSVTPG